MEGARLGWSLLGMDERYDALPPAADEIRNMHYNPGGYWETAGGTFQVTTFAEDTGPISALTWFEPYPNVRHLVVERRNDAETSKISRVRLKSTGYEDIATRRRVDSTDLGTQFLQNGRWLYILSPVDGLERWDGRRRYPVGFSQPAPAPRVAGSEQGFDYPDRAGGEYASGYGTAGFNDRLKQRGVGAFATSTNDQWLYGYALQLVNDLGQESPPSQVVWAAGRNETGEGKRMVRLLAPRVGRNIRQVRVLRTINLIGAVEVDSGATLYHHSVWPFAGGFDLLDTVPDSDLGEAVDRDETGVVPVGARALAFWQSSSWLAGMPDDPTALRYSSPLFVEQFPEFNRLPVGSAATGPIVGLLPHGRTLLVFKRGGVYAVKGSPDTGYRVDPITELRGAGGPHCYQVIPDQGLICWDDHGPYLLQGTLDDDMTTRVVPLDAPIRRTLRRVGSLVQQIRSAYDPEHHEVWFAVPEGGYPYPRLGLVYHTLIGQWSLRTDYEIGAMTVWRGRLWVGSWNDSTAGRAGVHVVTRGSRTRAGAQAVTAVYNSAPLRTEDDRSFTAHRALLVGLSTGASFTVQTRTDRQLVREDQHEGTRRFVHPDVPLARWGESSGDEAALWGTDYRWADYERTRVAVSLRLNQGLEQELRVSSGRMGLIGLVLSTTLKPGELPNIMPRER